MRIWPASTAPLTLGVLSLAIPNYPMAWWGSVLLLVVGAAFVIGDRIIVRKKRDAA